MDAKITFGSTSALVLQHAAGQESDFAVNGAGVFVDISGHATASNNNIIFRTEETNSQYTPTELMRIQYDGNVGIGSTAPGNKLEVLSANSGDGIKIGRNTDSGLSSGDYQQLLFSTRIEGDYTTAIRSIQANASGVGLYLNPRLGFFVQNTDTSGIGSMTEKVSILGSGNVGISTTIPASTLDVKGSIGVKTVSKTADYTATASDYIILVDSSGGAVTITLPAASGVPGRAYEIKKTDSSGNGVIIDANASETIDGALTVTTTTQYQSFSIVCDGSNWLII